MFFSFVTENAVGGDLIHPEDIAVELPPDGPWRLANSDSEGVMLLRFGRKTDLSMRERHIAARHVGVLSKTRREELLMEQERALQREAEKKRPVDKKNPWGNAAESWAIETRGRVGTDFDDYLAAYTKERGRVKRDWDDPGEEEVEEVGRKSGGIKGRLGGGGKAREEDMMEEGEGDEDMEWAIKMKRPRMGMVADIVEKGSARNRLGHGESETRRKVARRSGDSEEEDSYQDLRQKTQVEDRVIKTAGRRLLNDRFAGGRLAGRIGFGGAPATGQTARPRLADRLGSRPQADDMMAEEGREDSLERDMGDDLRGMMDLKNMVVKVTRSEGERGPVRERAEHTGGNRDRERGRDRGGERSKHSGDREEEIRQRLKQIKREKELIDEEKRHKHGSSKHVRKDKDRGGRVDKERDGESSAFISQIKERAKKLEKYKSKGKESSDESDSDSSESDNSESESSDDSSESESESSEEESESNDSSSSDSEEERRQQSRRKERASSSRHKPPSSSREKPRESKHGHKSSEKRSGKSSGSGKKETAEESKKAAELRDQLRNYLKKAKEAKEKKRK